MRGIFLFALIACAIVSTQCRVPLPIKPCCGNNEIWKKCGGCDGSCANPYPCCNQGGPPGCYCLPGYVRDLYGNCIPACDCPRCGCNEVWRCGNCDPCCTDKKKKCCCACKMACYCKCGYVRNCKGECVPIKKCKKKKPCPCKHKKHDDEGDDEGGDEDEEAYDEDEE